MVSMRELMTNRGVIGDEDATWLRSLTLDWQIIADLSFADLLLWVPTEDGKMLAVAQCRPSGISTTFARDLVGDEASDEWERLIRAAMERGVAVDASAPDWFGRSVTQIRAIPVRCGLAHEHVGHHPIAVLTQHINLNESRTPSRMELGYRACADGLLTMVREGAYPDKNAPSGPRRGAPRVADGVIRLDANGNVVFASPNATTALHGLGLEDDLDGKNLAEVATQIIVDNGVVDESLPLVVTGRAPWRTDVEVRGQTVTLRSIPLLEERRFVGAIILARDVTDLRRQEQELLTKDATIREIHHRVKNNLQTVASLLRIQARRATNAETTEALLQAMRRVESIAVVHDTLSSGLQQNVDFDTVFDRVMQLTVEVAASGTSRVYPVREGSFGDIPSNSATALALALTELVSNAVMHGLDGKDGEVRINAHQTDDSLVVVVADTGKGMPEGKVGTGLGTQIVRTLIEGELGGTIDWHTLFGAGTEVTITIPKRWHADH